MKWISVKDDLPCWGDQVLAWDGDYFLADVTRDEKTRDALFVDPEHGVSKRVTHWMPLPNPPQ